MSKRQSISKRGIEVAAQYLSNTGAEVVEREWKCDSGIADLIIKEDTEIAFVQVNTRKATTNGYPADLVTKSTRSKFEKLALSYLVTHEIPSCKVRFDIISVLICENSKAFLRHHRDAIASGA